jgi:hypothetical protein
MYNMSLLLLPLARQSKRGMEFTIASIAPLVSRQTMKRFIRCKSETVAATPTPTPTPTISKGWKDRLTQSSLGFFNRGSAILQDSLDKTSEVVANATRHAVQASSDSIQQASHTALQATKTATTQVASHASSAATRALQHGATLASRAVVNSTKAVASVAMGGIQSSLRRVGDEVRSTRDQAFRWFFWWSLAAVGVYGVATTLPRELIQYAAAKKTTTTVDVEKKESIEIEDEESSIFQKFKREILRLNPWNGVEDDKNKTTNTFLKQTTAKWRQLLSWEKKDD